MTDKEIQASDEEMEQFNVLQNEKCVSVKTEKLNDLKNRISFALKERVKVIKENEELKKQIDSYKAFESHYDEIEEDAKAIAKENEDLKNQIEQMKCCGNCQSVFDADGFCYLYKDGKCINQSEWIKRSNK